MKRRDLKKRIDYLLSIPVQGIYLDALRRLGVDDGDANNYMLAAAFLFYRAMGGDLAAYKLLMDLGGYSPKSKRGRRYGFDG